MKTCVKRTNSISTYCGRDVRSAGSSAVPILAAASPVEELCSECLADPQLEEAWPVLVKMVSEVLG